MGVLDGYRVLDFGRYIAGPACAALLGDLGADVIRVERVGGGEDRRIVPLADDDGGALYLHVNRGKRGVTLDLASPAGAQVRDGCSRPPTSSSPTSPSRPSSRSGSTPTRSTRRARTPSS